MTINGISNDISSIAERTHAIQEDIGQLREGVARLDYAIRGNGTPGLATRMDRVERTLEHMAVETAKERAFWRSIMRWAGGIVGAVLTAFLISLIVS